LPRVLHQIGAEKTHGNWCQGWGQGWSCLLIKGCWRSEGPHVLEIVEIVDWWCDYSERSQDFARLSMFLFLVHCSADRPDYWSTSQFFSKSPCSLSMLIPKQMAHACSTMCFIGHKKCKVKVVSSCRASYGNNSSLRKDQIHPNTTWCFFLLEFKWCTPLRFLISSSRIIKK
jgi:hypothetical protein